MSTAPEGTHRWAVLEYRGKHAARKLWKVDFESSTDYDSADRSEVLTWPEANCVSSECHDGYHMPALDIDHFAEVYKSSTFGHHHLYIAVKMPWWKYRLLLRVMVLCGILEKGYYKASVRRRATMLRIPGIPKGDG